MNDNNKVSTTLIMIMLSVVIGLTVYIATHIDDKVEPVAPTIPTYAEISKTCKDIAESCDLYASSKTEVYLGCVEYTLNTIRD